MKFILKFVLLCMASIFLLSLLLAAIIYFFFAMIRWLFTGERPQVIVFMNKFNQWKKNSVWPQRNNENENIIDAEVRDVTEMNKKLTNEQKRDL